MGVCLPAPLINGEQEPVPDHSDSLDMGEVAHGLVRLMERYFDQSCTARIPVVLVAVELACGSTSKMPYFWFDRGSV